MKMGVAGKEVRLGIIGLGGRGRGQMKTLLSMPDVQVTCVCDLYEDRVQAGIDICREMKGNEPVGTKRYREVLTRDDVDAVVVMTSWTTHLHIATEALRAGKPITRKGYDYKLHRRCDSDDLIYPSDVVLLEGIHVFYDPAVRDLLDFKIFIQVDPDICLLRRVQRDIVERARHVDSVARQYLETVKPMFERYIRNYVEYADLIVARGGKNARIVDILAFYINSGMVKPET